MTEKKHPYQPWLSSFLTVARHYRLDVSEENVRVFLEWERGAAKKEILSRIAKHLGLSLRVQKFSVKKLDPWNLPLVVEFDNDQVGVVIKTDGKGTVNVLMADDGGLTVDLSVKEVQKRAKLILILRPESAVSDVRVDDYIKPFTPNWFWHIMFKDWRNYTHILIASFLVNLLALASVIFSMQVYDRVIPAQSSPTLWVLFGGVLLAICFEFLLRMARTHVSDVIGKRIDLKISDKVFGRALRLRNDVRPQSTGSFVSQLRELEQLREIIASSTVNAMADVPFVLLFLAILFIIGGPLGFVALAMLPLLIIPGLLAQKPLGKLAKQGMREAALRNAIMIESVEASEDIKLLRAEHRFQNQWNQANSVAASINLRQRRITSFLLSWTQELQSITYVTVVLVGAYLVIKGDITTGVLVGSSILSSRMMGPLAQWSGVLSRLQQAKVAYSSITELMKRPVDQPEQSKLLHRPVLLGNYQLGSVQLRYSDKDKLPALDIKSLNIKQGERVAILGRMGAGKSTLLQLLAGMVRAQQGNVLLDDTDILQIDPADVRRDVGLLSQNSRLLFGSIRENIIMGSPLATDEEIIRAIQVSGAAPIIQTQAQGIDYVVREGGAGLSGGQKQALLLARTLIKDPNVLLLDEPTAAMDEITEQHVVHSLEQWLAHRTLVVATHKPAILKLVERVVVVDNGRIVLDGPKETILASLTRQNKADSQKVKNEK